MDKEECIEQSEIIKTDAGCYIVKITSKNKWIGSPTNILTSFKGYAACIENKEKAKRLRDYHCDPNKNYPAEKNRHLK